MFAEEGGRVADWSGHRADGLLEAENVLLVAAVPLLNSVGYYVLFNYLPTYLTKQHAFSSTAGFITTSVGLLVMTVRACRSPPGCRNRR